MKDILSLDADIMRNKSIDVNSCNIERILFTIDKRLKNANTRELKNHSVYISISDIYDNKKELDIIIKEIKPFIISKGFTVETETIKADNINYITGISIHW